jgi:hypothetical protein
MTEPCKGENDERHHIEMPLERPKQWEAHSERNPISGVE